jgi:hypothetical protein
MCYSGKCYFENYMGDCIVYLSSSKFLETYGWPQCFIGGSFQCPEDEEEYNLIRHNLVFLYNQKRAFKRFR